MIWFSLTLLLVAAFLAGAALTLWWVSPPTTAAQRHVDALARRDRQVRRA